MIVYFLFGAIFIGILWGISNFLNKDGRGLVWWHWLLTIILCLYSVLVVATIHGFLIEDVAKGALVMGLVMGIPAVIFDVLLVRLVLNPKKN